MADSIEGSYHGAAFMLDTSAYTRMRAEVVQYRLDALTRDKVVFSTSVLRLEMLFYSVNVGAFRGLEDELKGLPIIPISQADFDRAQAVLGLLAEKSEHRGSKIGDLLVAAVAERNDLTIIHYDKDFDAIAAVTGQSTEWVVPRGSID